MREFSKHIDTWNIITLAFFGKTGWYYYWGNNTLLKAKTTDWLGLNCLIATVWNYSRLSLYFPLSVFKVPHATNGSILLSSSLSGGVSPLGLLHNDCFKMKAGMNNE